ncbi:cilia- and flagella-associated protein 206-like [Microplitis mediator]|uniref:cilia- and flagella-associated protein 206-like n=1 Tax=Microplitis mediator TaxID=375433 RepID=UPI00255272DB|nr:cilia- and flagella-associated protein 206-like [Microplitis mediator]
MAAVVVAAVGKDEQTVDLVAAAEAEVEAEAEPGVELKAEADAELVVEPEAEPGADPEAESEVEQVVGPEAEPEAESEDVEDDEDKDSFLGVPHLLRPEFPYKNKCTNFVTLPKKAKNKQLIELMSIVAGIRLFNKDCQRGGHGIDNLPNILQESLEKSCNSTLKLLEDLMSKIYRLTAAVENIANNYFDKKTKSGCSDDEKFSEIKLIIGTLVTCRQQEIYVRKVLSDLEKIKAEFKILMDTLEMRLHKLHDSVKFRTAISIVQVYIRLEKFTNNSEILSDAERLERSMGKLINECGDCLILYPNTSENFQEIQLEFQGFCAWTFVAGYGALIPGNPNIGIVKWRARYFAFSSDYAASQFGKDPNRYMYEALDFVRKNPEYIRLFNLHEDIELAKYSHVGTRFTGNYIG